MPTIRDGAEREEEMKKEGQRIVAEAEKRDLYLRLLGAIAFQIHCPKFSFFTRKLNRVLSDVDFAAYGKQAKAIGEMMRELGYADQKMITALWGNRRTIWDNDSSGMHVDIFFDKLEMNHDIPFVNRLELEPLTIPLADLLLEKMQIVNLNEKDVVDTIMLLREHEIADPHPESIDTEYIAELLSNDWGFYYTVTTNLGKVRNRLTAYQELRDEDRANVETKISRLLKIIEEQPKALAWKMRARVGPRNKWYRDVEEVRR